jgi:ferritin-like protein
MASEGLHEQRELLDDATVDYHRAVTSLCEELEAIDWYDQRVKATSDPSLAAVLAYNRDDEKEHAAMALEWIRRHDPALDANLRKFLFTTTEPITEVGADGSDAGSDGGGTPAPAGASTSAGASSLGIGSLKGVKR